MLHILAIVFWFLIGFSGWRVYSKAGFKGYLGLLFLLPVANFVVLLYLAHTEWPASSKPNNQE